MTLSTIQVLGKAADLGLKLSIGEPDRLMFHPVDKCPPDFVETLRTYKPRLLALLSLPFVLVFSESLGDDVFFCADEQTKAALVQAGADKWQIYTRAELKVLVEQNRVAPLSHAEIRKVHEIKRTFSGRITS